MADIVRTLSDSDLPDFLGSLRTAFLTDGDPSDEQVAWFSKRVELDRTFGAFPDGRLRGGMRSFGTDITVPGGAVRAAAVTQVNVLPTHRRQGLLTAMMAALLRDARDRGEALAILIASEWPIYGRFGYGPATELAGIEIAPHMARFRHPPAGSIDFVRVDEIRAVAPAVYEEAAERGRPGFLSRHADWWDVLLDVDPRPGREPAPSRRRVVWRDRGGTPRGYVVYDAKDDWQDARPAGRLDVRELVAATPDAYRELWRYLCSVDLVSKVHAFPRPVDEILPHLLVNGRAVGQTVRADHMWVRILDLAAALEGRRYGREGRIVIEVEDAFLGGTQRVELDGSPDRSACEPSAAPADLRVEAAALGACYMGGTSLATLAAAGQVVEERPGAVALADAMFGVRPAPFLTTDF